jgi:hypothetical protein
MKAVSVCWSLAPIAIRHVDIAVGHGDQAQVFLGHALTLGGELGNCRARGRFGGLSAGVGVNFGVQHQDFDVASGSQDVVEAAVANVISPAVAADDPHALAHQDIHDAQQAARVGYPGDRRSLSSWTFLRCSLMPSSLLWSVVRSASTSSSPMDLASCGSSSRAYSILLVEGQAHAQAELGIIFEQRVRPGRAAAFIVLRPGCGGQVAAVDGRAAGRIGDHDAVAEQLAEQLQVGGFTAARAGAGELEQRLQQLRILDCLGAHRVRSTSGRLRK